NKVVDIIVEQVHNQNGKLVISGMGKAGQVGQNLATTFCSTGTPSIFLHPSEAQHGDLGILQRNDALLLITNSGKTREIIELLDLARNIYSSIPIIFITGNTDSFLANEADVCLFTGHPDEVCPLKLTPTTSITVMTVIGDLLVINTMKRINFNEKEYAKRHHGGYLGDMSRSRSV
ncbi:MAG: SIS domain-containing protein, partial [Dysgonamonadaceae bacterium]|nr:SIS domain-containing protein [Dysgonamonadaceae bacterium]